MAISERWRFDIALHEDQKILSIEDLLADAENCFRSGDYAACYSFLRRAASSDSGKLRLARFYLTPGTMELAQEKRYREAEKLLLEITDISDACLVLSQLYLHWKRPMAALAWRLHSSKMLEGVEIESFKKLFHNLEIASLSQFPKDIYVLGMVLSEYQKAKTEAIRLLQLACEYGSGAYVGVAALRIADLTDDPNEQHRYLKFAGDNGNPEILRRNK